LPARRRREVEVVAGLLAHRRVDVVGEDLALVARRPQRVADPQHVVADGVAGGEHREELVNGGQLRASSSATRASRAAIWASSAIRSAVWAASRRSSRSATTSANLPVAWPRIPTWWPR